ncbi:MAG TPA: hypothetical protein VG710_11405 [Opitutus sp.]|nr:hypothetical protein [Opitutus sp.]
MNPINSKLYSQFTTQDWVWLRIANIGTLLLALALWWFVQRFLARKIDEKARA